MPKGRRARWIMELQQHHFTIEHRAGKHNANADALSRMYDEDENSTECFMIGTLEESSDTDNNESQWNKNDESEKEIGWHISSEINSQTDDEKWFEEELA